MLLLDLLLLTSLCLSAIEVKLPDCTVHSPRAAAALTVAAVAADGALATSVGLAADVQEAASRVGAMFAELGLADPSSWMIQAAFVELRLAEPRKIVWYIHSFLRLSRKAFLRFYCF